MNINDDSKQQLEDMAVYLCHGFFSHEDMVMRLKRIYELGFKDGQKMKREEFLQTLTTKDV